MNKFSKIHQCIGPLLVSIGCAVSPVVAAQSSPEMPMQLYLTITETIAPTHSDPDRCPADSGAMGIGMVAGSGIMNVATGPGPKIVTLPVIFASSDCPNPAFQFSYGAFMLTTPTGHQLYANYYGGFYSTNETTLMLDPGRSVFVLSGGTGYFAGASGRGTLGGYESILRTQPSFLGFGNMEAKGTITFKNPGFAQRFMNNR
ncbi:hypothetical protein ABC383_07290 [Noviherbaspirillum sp. 1P10PC]|uniref:hypothetical protein n=1 Tax=Noviherbaspirillum sp. 1P10PC TaxID=3132292 RepID=UPI0039A1DE83